MTSPDSQRLNQLLAALPDVEWERWKPQLELIDMPLGKVLYESGAAIAHVHFPTTAIVSLLYVLENGSSAETAVVGFEGVVGVSAFMTSGSMPSRAVVQSAGQGYRLRADAIRSECERSGPVLGLMMRYTQGTSAQHPQRRVLMRDVS
ncbi:MAG: Crp/Fnr family transcriptional regulator, partial [Hydrogenophaga sp.]|nr:Crp/Fnr family transcriptional regulator [Hydrogenophaga sp.]